MHHLSMGRMSQQDGGSSQSLLMQPKAPDIESRSRRAAMARREDYTVAWICALDLELAASRAMLDDEHQPLYIAGDDNSYILGRIGKHKVVMTSLSGQVGTNKAAIVATNLKRSFQGITATFMVGIGGGAPCMADLRLDDVVVGTSVMQYDLGKVTSDGQFQVTAVAKPPAWLLSSATSTLRTKHEVHYSSNQMANILQSRRPNLSRPNYPDYLFHASYEHPTDSPTCDNCDQEKLQRRRARSPDIPAIFYGGIASGNSVIKDAKRRDKIARQHKVLCFEMEAAGMMDNLQCLPIRGICDYADSHKNKAWQDYAAATAAAYAREFLEDMPHKLEPKTPFSLGRIAKSPIKYARQIWVRGPVARGLVVLFVALLASVVIIVTCVKVLANKAAIRNSQDTILPQILSSAELNGQTFLLARGSDGQLSFTTKEAGSWTHRWNRTDQQAHSQPTSLVWGNPKRLSVFYIRDDNMVMASTLNNSVWGGWEALGAKVSSPAVLCLEESNAIIHVWAREDTQAGLIQHNYWENGKDDWHTVSPSWESGINDGAATGALSAPAVVCRNSTATNDIIIYDKNSSSPLHRQWINSRNRWGPWHALGGFYVGDPVLVSQADDRLDFFGVSNTTKSLIHISWTLSSGYGDSHNLNGSWRSVPSVAVTASDRLDVFILSEKGTVSHRALLGSTWSSGWSDLNISATSAPLATRLNTTVPQIMLQVIAAGGVVLSSEWEATDGGGLMNVVPVAQIGSGFSADWMKVD